MGTMTDEQTSPATHAQSDDKKPLKRQFPAFEVSSSYENYAQYGGVAKDQEATEPEEREAVHENPEELSFEEQVDSVLTCVTSQNPLREVLYKTLEQCESPQDFSAAEAFISEQDEFVHSHIIQTPYTLIQMLIRSGGLKQTEFDANGDELTPERTGELSEDEIADIVERKELQTTSAGHAVVEMISPQKRFEAQLAQKPHRRDTYYALLEFCLEPHTLPEIEEFFKETSGLALDTVQIHHTLSPDYYVDKMEKAGILVWQGAWVATEAGRKALAARPESDQAPS